MAYRSWLLPDVPRWSDAYPCGHERTPGNTIQKNRGRGCRACQDKSKQTPQYRAGRRDYMRRYRARLRDACVTDLVLARPHRF